MTGQDRTWRECRELTPDELDDVSGGVVCITHPASPGIDPGSVILAGDSVVVGHVDAGRRELGTFSITITQVMDKTSPLF